MANLTNEMLYGLPVQKPGESYISFMERQDKWLEEQMEETYNLPDGSIKGAIVRFQVADGYAYYKVMKIRPLTLRHLPIGDNWSIPDPYIRGLKKADILQLVDGEKTLHRIFSEK